MIIITAKSHHLLEETFRKKGFDVLYDPSIDYITLAGLVHKAEGIVISSGIQVDKSLLDRAIKLKWIGRLGSGLELIDLDYAASKNILCISTPEGNRNAVAEHTLGLLLGLTKKITWSAAEVKNEIWLRDENRGTEISGKTIGLVGFGNTGHAFAKLLQGFGVTILAYDKYKENFGSQLVREVNLEQLCKYSDVISFHVPLTSETIQMAGEQFFQQLSQRPYILNTSRGKVLNSGALASALKNDLIRGAGLDVLENESLNTLTDKEQAEFNFLCNHPKVIITPHIAGYSDEALLKMSQVLIKKLGL